MNIVVFSTVGGVSTDVHVVRSPFNGERSKWCDEISNLQSKAADTSDERRPRERHIRRSILSRLIVLPKAMTMSTMVKLCGRVAIKIPINEISALGIFRYNTARTAAPSKPLCLRRDVDSIK